MNLQYIRCRPNSSLTSWNMKKFTFKNYFIKNYFDQTFRCWRISLIQINFLLYLQFPFIYPPATVQYVSNLSTIHMIVLVCGILLPGNRTLNASWTNRVVCKTQSGLSNSKKYILHMYILCLDIIANQVYIFKNLDKYCTMNCFKNMCIYTFYCRG